MIWCFPVAIVGTGAAAMGVTIALFGGGTEIIRPYGWTAPRPAVAHPYVRRAARPAAVVWGLRCYDTGYRGGGYGPGYGGPFAGPWGLPLGGFGGGFGSIGGGYADGSHRGGDRGLGVNDHGRSMVDNASRNDRGGAVDGPGGNLPVGLPEAGTRPDTLTPTEVPAPPGMAAVVLLALGAMLAMRRRG